MPVRRQANGCFPSRRTLPLPLGKKLSWAEWMVPSINGARCRIAFTTCVRSYKGATISALRRGRNVHLKSEEFGEFFAKILTKVLIGVCSVVF